MFKFRARHVMCHSEHGFKSKNAFERMLRKRFRQPPSFFFSSHTHTPNCISTMGLARFSNGVVLLFALLVLKNASSQQYNDDKFNFDMSSNFGGRDYGQQDWNRVTCRDPGQCVSIEISRKNLKCLLPIQFKTTTVHDSDISNINQYSQDTRMNFHRQLIGT